MPPKISPFLFQAIIAGADSLIDLEFVSKFDPASANILQHWPLHVTPDTPLKVGDSNLDNLLIGCFNRQVSTSYRDPVTQS